MAAALGLFTFLYVKYALIIEDKLGSGGMRTNSSIYASPKVLAKGDRLNPEELIARLRRAGYTDRADNPFGHFRRTADAIEIETGPQSYFRAYRVHVFFDGGKVSRISSKTENRDTDQFSLEPELVTNLNAGEREKRRPVAFSELPQHLIQAVISVEDKRFFDHSGLDLLRVAKAAYVDIKEGSKEQGASTITMQLARSFWLDQEKTWSRKIAEAFLTIELERRFEKQKIFELYANEVYLGRRGSFSIHGFGEAAQAYFGKDVRALNIPEAAMLAGLIQRPSYYNPFRYPERMKQRRDLVLTMMRTNGYLTEQQMTAAAGTAIAVNPGETESSDAPYFVDLVNEELQNRFQDWDFAQNAYRVYSTLDLELQKAAVEAVEKGMAEVDKHLRRVRGKKNKGKFPQVALIALDPSTGAVKALIGGRSYEKTQLNRALAKRQPGSAFKPFVYASALNSTIHSKTEKITAGSLLIDEPTTFEFNKQVYQPANFGHEYYGGVTVRHAVMKSLNIPTIKVAEKVGFKTVVDTARGAGITAPLQATPSIALGSYDIPPLEVAEAYTIFANDGVHVKRHWFGSIRDRNNRSVYEHKAVENKVLDPRVAYIMTDIMQDVMRRGTAAGARSRGFTQPAAGKTGTARDGWFAGFTSELLTVVWVGYDDYTELELEGSKSALPVWTEFMKRAHKLAQYSDAKAFKMPKGIVRLDIDPDTGLLATEDCLHVESELFVAGTEPNERCEIDHDLLEFAEDPLSPDGRPRRTWVGRVLDVFR
jgi:penicillin-binding protein 1B